MISEQQQSTTTQKTSRSPRDLTSGSIVGSIWFLALPMMATNFIHTMFHVVDMMYLGRLGPSAIAAVSISGATMMIPFALIMGIASATTAMVARYYGAGDIEQASQAAVQSLTIAAIGAIVVSILGAVFARQLIAIFGVEPDVLALGTSYIRILFLGVIAMALQFLGGYILQAVGDARTALIIVGGSSFLNILIDPLLIFGIWIFPRWEVEGAAVASVFARVVGCIVVLFVLRCKRTHLHIKFSYMKIKGAFLKKLLKIGTPSSLQMLVRSTSNIIMMSIVAGFGTIFLATYGVGIRIDMFVMMPGFGMAAATATLVGQNLGAKKPDRAEKCALTAAFYHFIIMTSAGILFYIFAQDAFRAFNDNPEVLSLGQQYLRIIIFSYPFIAIAVVFNRALIGAGNTLTPMLLTTSTLYGIQIPAAFLLPKLEFFGGNGLWVAIAGSNIVLGILITIIFRRGKWKSIVI